MTPDLPVPYDFIAEAGSWAWFEECDDGEYANASERRATLPVDLRAARGRLLGSLLPNLSRATFPYMKVTPRLDVGYAVAVHNPLLHPERQVERAVAEALGQAAHQRQSDDLLVLERLQDILLREKVITAYQPILRLAQQHHVALGAVDLDRELGADIAIDGGLRAPGEAGGERAGEDLST
jgi:hypothetical protein